MQVGIVVRDRFPDQFLDVHHALFTARHDEGRDIREEPILREILAEHGVDADKVFAEIADGWPARDSSARSTRRPPASTRCGACRRSSQDDQAVFVRADEPSGRRRGAWPRKTIERVVDLLGGWPELNEFKHTSIPR